MWSCPNCQRQFKHEFQNHSCDLITENDLFKNRSKEIQDLYNVLIAELRKLGPFRIEAVKPDVAMLKTESHFLQIKVKKNWLDVRFYLDYFDNHQLIKKYLQHSSKRYTYLVSIDAVDQIDAQLLDWCRHSYDLIND